VTAWIATGLVLLVALAAWRKARATARRLDLLTQQYWDLRYQHGQLRARVNQLDPETRDAETEEASAAAPPPQTFIPLSSLKRS
jgi:hypothetical protein